MFWVICSRDPGNELVYFAWCLWPAARTPRPRLLIYPHKVEIYCLRAIFLAIKVSLIKVPHEEKKKGGWGAGCENSINPLS